MNLKPIHRDILKLIRTLCYEGLTETRIALVDPHDRRLPLWKPNTYSTRLTLPDGVPAPIVRATLFAVTFDERKQRWGKDGCDPGPALQYLIDRGLLDVSHDDLPICAAFKNYFNDAEIHCTIRYEENENGQFYVWQTPSVKSVLYERDGTLVTALAYPVFKLTERAHALMDTETLNAEPAKPDAGDRAGELNTAAQPEVSLPTRALKAGGQYRLAAEALDVSEPTDREVYDQIAAASKISGEIADLPTFETWQRNLRVYRQCTGQQKNKPRAGRKGGEKTLVPSDRIEPEHLPTRIRPKSAEE